MEATLISESFTNQVTKMWGLRSATFLSAAHTAVEILQRDDGRHYHRIQLLANRLAVSSQSLSKEIAFSILWLRTKRITLSQFAEEVTAYHLEYRVLWRVLFVQLTDTINATFREKTL